MAQWHSKRGQPRAQRFWTIKPAPLLSSRRANEPGAIDHQRRSLVLVHLPHVAPGSKTASSPAGVARLPGQKPGMRICLSMRAIAALHLGTLSAPAGLSPTRPLSRGNASMIMTIAAFRPAPFGNRPLIRRRAGRVSTIGFHLRLPSSQLPGPMRHMSEASSQAPLPCLAPTSPAGPGAVLLVTSTVPAGSFSSP